MGSRLSVRLPSVAECREELRAVLSSRVFRQAENLSRLLEYVCEQALLGNAESVTEYTIAVDVFGKPRAFRDSRDSSVRVDVHRLRKRLALYYTGEGAGHTLRIVIPLGSYVPDFQLCEGRVAAVPAEEPLSSGISSPSKNGEGPGVLPARANTDAEASILPGPPPVGRPPRSRSVLATLAVCLVIVVAVVSWIVREHVRVAPQADAPVDNFPPAPAINKEVHILAGFSGKEWTDVAGRLWQPDRYFKGGVARPVPRNLPSAPPDRRLVETMREAGPDDPTDDGPAFSYDIPLQPGVYELHLYFADPLLQSPPPHEHEGEDNQNVRHILVASNGRPLLQGFDTVADAGDSDVDVRAFKDITPASDGKVHLSFSPRQQHPFVNAIELVPSRPGHANPVRMAARRTPYTDSDGKTWAPEDYFIRGRLMRDEELNEPSDLPELFRSERYGNFSYSIPVPAGSYALTLYFSETFFNPLAPSLLCRGSGCRVFDVSCNGTALLRDFDIYQAGGGAFRLVVRRFSGLRPNGQGQLLVSFSSSINYAEVRALEVVDETP